LERLGIRNQITPARVGRRSPGNPSSDVRCRTHRLSRVFSHLYRLRENFASHSFAGRARLQRLRKPHPKTPRP
jgi:hypothetical protein